jgi:hypothetical protein
MSNTGRMTYLRVATTLLFALSLNGCRHSSQPTAVEPYSTRDGPIVTLHPSGISFRVPQQWLEWNDQFHNNFHLSRDELQKVKNASGEWDTEYADVVNSALAFEDCAAHVGGEGWGKEGSSVADVQMRAYVTALREGEVLSRIHGPALSTAHQVAYISPSSKLLGELAPSVEMKEQTESSWKEIVLQHPLWFGDYGGTARIRFYITSIRRNTLVLVFMGGDDPEIEKIFHSVSVPQS